MTFSFITQVIDLIGRGLAASRFVDVSEAQINAIKANAILKGTKDSAKFRAILFEGKM